MDEERWLPSGETLPLIKSNHCKFLPRHFVGVDIQRPKIYEPTEPWPNY